MSRLYIVVDKASDWGAFFPSDRVITAMQYLKQAIEADEPRTQVINLCRSYRYLGLGYYVSLLAEARGHRVIPSVRTLSDLSKRSAYGLEVEDLGDRVTKVLGSGAGDTTDFSVLVYFGETRSAPLADLARQAFESFPCPVLRVDLERAKRWQIGAIKPVGFNTLTDDQEDAFAAALDHFSKRLWRKPRSPRKYRYELAMLHDPKERFPPSNKRALKAFVDAGRKLGVEVDPITRADYARLAEYDALFIRETTAIDHHTYRFASKAEKEDMVVIDDPTSILRCTNKIYLADLLRSRKLPTPTTEILYREEKKKLAELGDRLSFPLVLKVPDGSFSRGIVKVNDGAELAQQAEKLFAESSLLIAQEFLPTEFDWRIGVLAGKAIYACRYYMSRGHWQIYNHSAAKSDDRSGGFETVPVRDAPAEVVKTAVKATLAIGDGFYGVDMKQIGDRVVIIEVNDNPSIDFGVEDAYLGEDLYKRILDEFVLRLEHKRLGLKAK